MAGENKGSNARTNRRQRLAAALRENLVKRKAQARARRPADGDTTSDNNSSRESRSGNMLREDDEPSPSRE